MYGKPPVQPPRRNETSQGPTPAASTLTSTSPEGGSGVLASLTCSTSGPPNSLTVIACIAAPAGPWLIRCGLPPYECRPCRTGQGRKWRRRRHGHRRGPWRGGLGGGGGIVPT